MNCELKYHLQFWCLVIYRPFYQASVCCDIYFSIYILKHFLSPNDLSQFFGRKSMIHYEFHNHKIMTKSLFTGR